MAPKRRHEPENEPERPEALRAIKGIDLHLECGHIITDRCFSLKARWSVGGQVIDCIQCSNALASAPEPKE